MDSELVVELRRLEQQRGTGVLTVGDGAFHLVDGAIVAADCERTAGLDRLVVASGVATTEHWRRARLGADDPLLSSPRLETLALLSIFDAAYVLLAAPAPLEFRAGPPHRLARACRLTPGALIHECARRGDPTAGMWPVELVDRVAVVPVRRVRRRRVVLTGGQAEVLAAADARRPVTGLAELLGRTTYGCLLAVRELTAAGLIEPPAALAPTRPIAPARAETVGAAPDLVPPLRRRMRQAEAVAVTDRWEPPDRDMLVRLRAALEELA
ncbi:hypothetical protein [Nocardia yunnanensis]|uniref:hypothetical protein n=1 Tax=Nocardia yunnanensis TaxID=2382165 RepID=UPI0013C42D63|nr:hypothetical protein [Nocardia yunnanensis]